VQTRTLISWSTGFLQEIVTFEVRDASNGTTIVGPIDYILDALAEYGTLVVGDLNILDGALVSDLVVFEKDLTAPGPGNVRLLLVHAMPGRGAVDLYFEGVNPLTRVAQDVDYTGTSAYIEDRSTLGATNRLVVTPTGVPPAALTNVVEIDDATLDPGKVYIVVLMYSNKAPLPGDTDLKIYQQLQ
jgi:hypothetical protein